MNKVHLGGYMVKEADFRMTNSGSSYARFTMRVAGSTKSKETGKYESEFYDLIAFGKIAETISNYIHDKQFFNVTCHLKNDKYVDKETGKNVRKISIVVDNIDDFPPKQSSSTPTPMEAFGSAEEIMF